MNEIDIIVNIMLYGGGAVCAGLVIYFIWWFKTYKNSIVLKKIGQGSKYRINDRARIVKDGNGCFWWKTLKTKTFLGKMLPIPSDEAIELSSKGKQCATGYLSNSGQIAWQVDKTTNIDEFLIEPITLKERALYIAGLKQAVNRGKRSMLETLSAFALPITFIIIVAILVFGYGEFAKPILEGKATEAATAESLAQLSENLNNYGKDVQEIKMEVTGKSSKDPPS